MSLILDALKKSEAERQRQSGPTLLEVRVSPPRRRYPTWVIAVGVLLAVNILLLLAFVLHRPAASSAAAPTGGAAAGTALIAAPAPTSSAPPTIPPPLVSGEASAPLLPPRAFSPSDTVADGPNSISNPADDQPAVPAGGGSARLERDTDGRYAGLPSFSDVGGDLPDLRLDLHVYAERARDRYALINMHRVHEGDALPEGPRVLAITREGVALDYRGQEFMLHPQ